MGWDRSEARMRPITTISGLRKMPKPKGAQMVSVWSISGIVGEALARVHLLVLLPFGIQVP